VPKVPLDQEPGRADGSMKSRDFQNRQPSAGNWRRHGTAGIAAAMGAAVIVAISAVAPPGWAATPRVVATTGSAPRVIIDTDLSLYWDDATALGLANVLQQRHQVHILGVMSDVRNPEAVAAIDAINTAYGHSDIPLGAVADSDANIAPHGYSDALAAQLPHSIRNSDSAQSAVSLYRRLLVGQPDHSVTIVSLGGYSNLAGLLRSRAGQGSSLDGRALVAAKVKRLVIEDGLFPGDGPAFTNFKIDAAAARAVVGGAGWPTPMAWVDGFTGIGTQVGGSLCTTTPPSNPMRIVYQKLFGCGPPQDGDWDGPTMLYAVDGREAVFSELGRGGAAVLDAQGGLGWKMPSRRSDEVYVHVLDQVSLNDQIDALLSAR
jgi:hypothetical protein